MKKVTQLIAAIALASAPLAPVVAPAAAQGGVAIAGFETDGSVGLSREDYDAIARAATVFSARSSAATPRGRWWRSRPLLA